jgi:ribulose-phosphate 3-epimerase
MSNLPFAIDRDTGDQRHDVILGTEHLPREGRRLISASVDCADYLRLGHTVQVLQAEGVDLLHVDFVDGNFAPNLAAGFGLLAALSLFSTVILAPSNRAPTAMLDSFFR